MFWFAAKPLQRSSNGKVLKAPLRCDIIWDDRLGIQTPEVGAPNAGNVRPRRTVSDKSGALADDLLQQDVDDVRLSEQLHPPHNRSFVATCR